MLGINTLLEQAHIHPKTQLKLIFSTSFQRQKGEIFSEKIFELKISYVFTYNPKMQ